MLALITWDVGVTRVLCPVAAKPALDKKVIVIAGPTKAVGSRGAEGAEGAAAPLLEKG